MAKKKNDSVVQDAPKPKRRGISRLLWVALGLGCAAVVCASWLAGQSTSLPPPPETQTAVAIAQGQTATIVALTPTDTPTVTPTATDTPIPTVAPIPTDTPIPTVTALPSATATPRGYVRRADYGDAWPFTVEDGQVVCFPGNQVVFITGGVTYAVNGLAMGVNRYADIRPIWRDNPSGITPKVDIGAMIQMGLALCETAGAVPTGVTVAAAPIRPGNCSTAVAMGLEADVAGGYSHLDRDGDGVACYGD